MLPPAVLCALLVLTPAAAEADTRHTNHGVAGPILARPYFRHCRSHNQETFICWWNIKEDEKPWNANYTITYTVGQGQSQECPDYTTGGDRSCFFDSQHTHVWEPYCLKVMAHSPFGSAASEEFCLDVMDIVEPDPPCNLTWNAVTWEGSGTVLISWRPPDSADVRTGWMSLVYQLNYRPAAQQDDWKVKGPLSETQLQLNLPPGQSYLFQVRCKPKWSGRWSDWSDVMELHVPPTLTRDGDLVLALLLLVTVFLFIGLSCLLLGGRVKRFLLPPIPIPRISGIDSALLKKGCFEEIDKILMESPLKYIKTQLCEDFTRDIIQVHVEASPSPPGREIRKDAEDYVNTKSSDTWLPPIKGHTGKGAPIPQHYVSEIDRNTKSQFVVQCPNSSQRFKADEADRVRGDKCAARIMDIAAETSTCNPKSYMRVTNIGSHGAIKLQSCNFQAGYLLTTLSCQGTEEAKNQGNVHAADHSRSQDKDPVPAVEHGYVDHSQMSEALSCSVPEHEAWFSSPSQVESQTLGILDYMTVEHMLLDPQSIAEGEIAASKLAEGYLPTELPTILREQSSMYLIADNR